MKRIMMFIVCIFFILSGSAFGAATLIPDNETTEQKIQAKPRRDMYEYLSTTSVDVLSMEPFQIVTPEVHGLIVQARVKTGASTDCTIWISGSDDQTVDDLHNYALWKNINLSYTPSIPNAGNPIVYVNRDAVEGKFLYVYVQNNDAVNATGPWGLNLIFEEVK